MEQILSMNMKKTYVMGVFLCLILCTNIANSIPTYTTRSLVNPDSLTYTIRILLNPISQFNLMRSSKPVAYHNNPKPQWD